MRLTKIITIIALFFSFQSFAEDCGGLELSELELCQKVGKSMFYAVYNDSENVTAVLINAGSIISKQSGLGLAVGKIQLGKNGKKVVGAIHEVGNRKIVSLRTYSHKISSFWAFDITDGELRDYVFDLYGEPGQFLPLENAAKVVIEGVLVDVDSPSYTATYEMRENEALLISYQAKR